MAPSLWDAREVPESHCLRNPTRAGSSRATSSCWLSPGAGSCPQKETGLLYLEGELHDEASPSHAHQRQRHPGGGPRERAIDSEASETDCDQSIYSPLLLTPPTQVSLRHSWENLTI